MSTYAAAPNAYRQSSVLTASPGQLVVMLYDGANRFLLQSAVAMREGRPGPAGERLRRAEAIIDELLQTLNMDAGGEVAVSLQSLYVFFKDHLRSARRDQDADKVDDVARMMRELRASWAQLAGS
jgi:flagellar secretion chaperone FliS